MGIGVAGKHVLITGASRGIGLATAQRLLQAGAYISLLAKDESRLKQAASELRELYPKGKFSTLAVDLRNTAKIGDVIAAVERDFGPVQVLINNAGVYHEGPTQTARTADWDSMIDLNLRAPMYLTRAVLPAMLAAKTGAIVNVGSIAGKQGYAGCTAYCAAKFGLRGFSEALFAEVREAGILVSYVAPGMTLTDMGKGIVGGDASKMIDPRDVAEAIYWLLNSKPNAAPVNIDIWPQRDVFS